MKQIKLKVSGKVQRVFYRDAIRRKAEELELSGFARNEDDGTVTIVAEGQEADLIKLLEAAWQGSPSSKVENVIEEWHNAEDPMGGFSVL